MAEKQDEGVEKKPQEAPAEEKKEEVKKDDSEHASAEPDWSKLLQEEKEKRERAERDRDNYRDGLLSEKDRRKKLERGESTEEETEGLDEKIARGVERAMGPVVDALKGNRVEQILGSLVSDPSKQAYVKELYQTRIQRTGTSDEAIRRDLEEAIDLADSKRIKKENSELKRMQDNRTYVPPNAGGGTGGDRGVDRKPHGWSPEQVANLEQRARMNGITDVNKYIELAWKQAQEGSAFNAKSKYL